MPPLLSRAYRDATANAPPERGVPRRLTALMRSLTLCAVIGGAMSTRAQGQVARRVEIQPGVQGQASQAVSVTIYWCDKDFALSSSRTITFKGQDITAQFTYNYQGFGVFSCATYYGGTPVYSAISTGTVSLTGGETIDTLTASIYNVNGTQFSKTQTWTIGNTRVSVTPHGGTAAPPPNTPNLSVPFTVTNVGNMTATYAFQVVNCSGGVSACSPNITSQMVGPGGTATVNVSYTSGAAYANGTIELKASVGQYSDVGTVYTTATPTSVANTRVLVSEVNPGTTIERSQCLTFAVFRDVASQCGALRVTHALPAVRTLGKLRTPTLLYYSDLVHPPDVAVHVILADTVTQLHLDSVQANMYQVNANGSLTLLKTRTYNGQAWFPNRAQRITFDRPYTTPQTILKYRVEVKILRGSTWTLAAPMVDAELAYLDYTDSPFGGGWWLAGLERLYPQADGTILWVGGDASTRKYVSAGTQGTATVYIAPALTRADTLLFDAGEYRRLLPGGVRVYFSGSGLHARTVNRLGHTTVFNWNTAGTRLDSMQLPPWRTVNNTSVPAHTYRFHYSTLGQLDTITAPQAGPATTQRRQVVFARKVISGQPSRGVEKIIDLMGNGKDSVTFGFQSWGPEVHYANRTDRRGVTTYFSQEGNAPTMAMLWMYLGDSDGRYVSHTFRTVSGIGATGGSVPVPVDSAYFLYDGPRNDTTDVTKFWLDRSGAPTRIVNARGKATVVRRDDWRFPGLVTRVESPTLSDGRQRVQTATFDSLGNLKTSVDVNPYGGNRDAVTRYEYDDSVWKTFVTRIVPPERDSVVIHYDADGNRDWQRDARGDSTKVYFRYGNSYKLLSSVLQPGGAVDSLTYSYLGNVGWTRSPRGDVATITQDSLGRDSLTLTPVDSAQTKFRRETITYNLKNRVTGVVTVGDSVGIAGQQQVNVANTYDPEGNLTSVDRWSTPDVPPLDGGSRRQAIGHIKTRWDYDALGRKTREYAPDNTPADSANNPYDLTHYDLAGNVDMTITRGLIAGKPDTITMSYDGLNMLKIRRIPQVTYAARRGIIQTYPPLFYLPLTDTTERGHSYPRYPNVANDSVYRVAKDSAVFTYDEIGNLTRAENRDAIVRRGYYLNGLVGGDTLNVRTVAELGSGGNMTTHQYVLAYTYDLDGRRTQLSYPPTLAPSSGWQGTSQFAYTADGNLSMVTDPLGYAYQYRYNARGERTRWTIGSRPSFYEAFAYDADGNVMADTVYDSGTTGGTQRNASLTYYPGGKIKDFRNTTGTMDTTWSDYSGLGHVVRGAVRSHGTTLVRGTEEGHSYLSDALANVYTTNATSQYYDRLNQQTSGSIEERGYESGTGRLAWVEARPGGISQKLDTTYYDPSGNVAFQTTILRWGNTSGQEMSDRVFYYGADGKPRASEWRSYNYGSTVFQAAFEEYRYDALGRRILVHARRYCYNDPLGDCSLDWVRRTVWDGAAEVFEVQMPVDPSYVENDASPITLATQLDKYGTKWDPNPFYGRVAYAHGLGTDQPQSIIRIDYVAKLDSNRTTELTTPQRFAPVPILPLWDARGQPERGLYTDLGWNERCTTVSSKPYCVRLIWPGKYFAYELIGSRNLYWHGTLLEDKQDAVATYYRRNRYYDAKIGRFTQEDPIGLAGGLNLYGFAGGDPVNFSDPFGLCPVENDGIPCESVGMVAGGATGLAIGVAMAAGCAGATFGICAAGGPLIVGATTGLGTSLGGLLGALADFQFATKASGRTASGGYTDEYGNELGPSGKPKVHVKKHSTLKGAKDAAREEGDGAPVKHPSPTVGDGHFHPTRGGKKVPNSTHHEYPQ